MHFTRANFYDVIADSALSWGNCFSEYFFPDNVRYAGHLDFDVDGVLPATALHETGGRSSRRGNDTA